MKFLQCIRKSHEQTLIRTSLAEKKPFSSEKNHYTLGWKLKTELFFKYSVYAFSCAEPQKAESSSFE